MSHFFEAKLKTNQIASQFCNGKLEGVIDSRGDNKSTIDSISDNGDILITFYDDEINKNRFYPSEKVLQKVILIQIKFHFGTSKIIQH